MEELFVQNYNPFGDIWLSAIIAAMPIFVFLLLLVVLKLKGYVAAFITVSFSIVISVLFYDMPLIRAFMSFIYGFLYGLWPIAWIILCAILLYKISVKSGHFENLKTSITMISADHRIQVILIAFCFGSFLEGAIGFGAPVAISAALLMGLGLKPLSAAGLSMIANTAGAAFGAVGIPVTALAGTVNVDPQLISTMVARMLPPITFTLPFLLVLLVSGLRGLLGALPHVIIVAASYTIAQYVTAKFIGPELVNIVAAIVSIFLLSISVRIFKIKEIFRVEGSGHMTQTKKLSFGDIIKAWLPFILIIAAIGLWNSSTFKSFAAFATIKFEVFNLHNLVASMPPITTEQQAMSAVYGWDILRATGTAILLAVVLSVGILRINFNIVVDSAKETIKEMGLPIITIGFIVAYAYIAKYSGQAATMGLALSNTGNAFGFFSPVIGWLGVFLTGSVTSANLLFGTLQQVTASQLGVPDVIFMAANTVGGVVGKIISPQSIAVACAAVGMAGRESEVLKFTLKYSLLFIILAGTITWSVVNIFTFLVPVVANFN
ncbi:MULTISPECIES: lactate permease LctP family transporter [unclassified Campylobacter]|uniref:lactate permease LctP family transporter n=1 Tax=unclassified Campylobacter TaxID=2593542 RepID=UPI003D358425